MRKRDMAEHVKWTIMVMLALIIILIYVGVKETGRADRGEVYRQQLIALCAAEAHAFMQEWDIKKIYLSEFDYPEVNSETAISFDAVKKNWNGTETKIQYTVFQGGKVVITGSGSYGQEKFIQQMNLGSSVEFSKIGKK